MENAVNAVQPTAMISWSGFIWFGVNSGYYRVLMGGLSGGVLKINKSHIMTIDLKGNKMNPTEYDKLKREYELTKQSAKNRSEIETKRVINARKRLEKAYSNTLEEELVFKDNENALNLLAELQEKCSKVLKGINEDY